MKVIILLGTNVGDRLKNLSKAKELIAIENPISNQSRIYETAAWGNTNQDHFLNQAIQIETNFSAIELLEHLLGIENQMGRKRLIKWEPRIIDLDIIYYDSLIIQMDNLVIPHPELTNRAFVLKPLVDIIPDFIHPILQQNNKQLLLQCIDKLPVTLY